MPLLNNLAGHLPHLQQTNIWYWRIGEARCSIQMKDGAFTALIIGDRGPVHFETLRTAKLTLISKLSKQGHINYPVCNKCLDRSDQAGPRRGQTLYNICPACRPSMQQLFASCEGKVTDQEWRDWLKAP